LADPDVGGQRLLTQDMLACLYGADGLGSVLGCDSRDDNSLDARVCQHLVEIGVYGDAFETALCPCHGLRVWVADCYELGSGCLLEVVDGMTGAHATKATDGNFECADHVGSGVSYGGLVRGVRMPRLILKEQIRLRSKTAWYFGGKAQRCVALLSE
jgi:hypothetical protein